MKVCVLASGSNGNSTLIDTGKRKILVDCGITFKQIKERLQFFNIDIYDIDTLFITHEHIDHVKGFQMLFKNLPNLNLIISNGTFSHLKNEDQSITQGHQILFVKGKDKLKFDELSMLILPLHHDAHETIGLAIKQDGKKIVYATDTGYIDQEFYPDLVNADIYVLESNYDVEMLYSSNRPYELKQRIAGDNGHMSNIDSAITLSKLIGANTKTVVLAHISEDCNFYEMPKLIMKTHEDVYKEVGIDTSSVNFVFGNRNGVTGEFEI